MERLRSIPSVDRLLREAAPLLEAFPRGLVVQALREASDEVRRRLAGEGPAVEPGGEARLILEGARQRLERLGQPGLRRVINATGVILHTNLGRAVLPAEALAQVVEAAGGYCNLELDLESGQRGSRHSHLEGLLKRLTGAEAALTVNNCAAAVMLLVDTLARGKEVVVSRGELIEIGGSYRLPDVLRRGGARLVEVGTTNKTYLRDYEEAITPDTGLLLVSHTSNYRVVGFTHRVEPADLAALGRSRGIPVAMDLGSGLMVDPSVFGLPAEPTVPAMVAAGFDAVAFSGDKLLGGPQAGLLVGRAEILRRLAQNPMVRALRVDKMTVAALEAVLRLYLDPAQAVRRVPVLAALALPPEALEGRARALAGRLQAALGGRVDVGVEPGISSVGGGSLPGQELPTTLVRLTPRSGGEGAWALRLRRHRPAVVCRCHDGSLVLDLRTVATDEEEPLAAALEATAP